MLANDKKPHYETPEDELTEELTAGEAEDPEQALASARPATVSEADWIDQQIAEPIDEEDHRD